MPAARSIGRALSGALRQAGAISLSALTMFALALPFGLLAAEPAGAQEAYPSRTVNLVVPFPPGGPTDLIARITADQLSARWGQPVVVENRPGATGVIGSGYVARAKPDGYTLLWAASGPIGQMELLQPSTTNYRSLEDFVSVVRISTSPTLMWVNKKLNVKTVAELVALAKTKKLTYGSSGAGSGPQVAMDVFMALAGIEIVHVPFAGVAPATQAFLGEHIDVLNAGVMGTYDQITQAGIANPIATYTSERYSGAAAVPTLAEQNFAAATADFWFGILAPANTPEPIVAKIEKDVLAILADPAVQEKIKATGASPFPGDRNALRESIQRDLEKIKKFQEAKPAAK